MELKTNTIAIIQARSNSVRLPGKIFKLINNKSILEILIKRLSKSINISKIIVAFPDVERNMNIINICKKLKIDYFSGSEKNVLNRFYEAAKKFKATNIVRITGDCPLIDPRIVDKVIKLFFLKKVDYASNANPPSFPDGLDVEVFTFKALKDANINANCAYEYEHVTPYIINNNKFRKCNLKNPIDYSSIRLTLDDNIDFKVIKNVFEHFHNNLYFSLEDLIKLYHKNQNLFLTNNSSCRNQGSDLSVGQKMWIRAKNIIPGGTMLFSKNPDLYLPKLWPAYFEKTKGCYLWDLENKKYLDCARMSLGANILGYSHKEVDKAVQSTVQNGNMSTLNAKEDIILSEKLIDMHPWAEMAWFTRSGGEANAVAIRIARAASGKDNVAICGYHGWHDWYLSANIGNSRNLDRHLMKNLQISGVNKKLKNTAFQFEYNNYEQLEKIINTKNIGIIKMEVMRNIEPKNNFLKKIRKLASSKNIILIFDECTSGFRETFGGLHLKYDVNPDIAIFGKALGNGYAVNSIIGKRNIMEQSKSTFISSTFWTERIGTTAAIKTLEVMERIKAWKQITRIGQITKKKWKNIADSNRIEICIDGIDALPQFNLLTKKNNNLVYKTLITQEMLKKRILASNCIYLSTEHKKDKMKKYFDVLNNVFKIINKCENERESIDNYLICETAKTGIRN